MPEPPAARCWAVPARRRPGLAPGGAPGAHPRRAERRRDRGLGAGLGARRPAGPDAGRGRAGARTSGARGVRGPVLTPERDFTGKVAAARACRPPSAVALPGRGSRTCDDPGVRERAADRVVHAPRRAARAATCRSCGRGDLAGQGWGINPDLGGYRIFRAMRGARARTSSCAAATTIYADGPLTETVDAARRADLAQRRHAGEDARSPRRSTSSAASSPTTCSTSNLRAFAAAVPQINQWDDHEVRNNWYPGQILDRRALHREARRRARRPGHGRRSSSGCRSATVDGGRIYRQVSHGPLLDVFVLDMRTYKDPNDANVYADPQRGLLGARSSASGSSASSPRSHGDLEGDRQRPAARPRRAGRRRARSRASRRATRARRSGRELEFAEVLRVRAPAPASRGMVFLTADVHYTSAHHYDPSRAAFGDFDPVLGVRLRPAQRGRVRPERAGRARSARRRCS